MDAAFKFTPLTVFICGYMRAILSRLMGKKNQMNSFIDINIAILVTNEKRKPWDRCTRSPFWRKNKEKSKKNGKFQKEIYVQDCGRLQVYYFFNVTFSLRSVQTCTTQEVVDPALCMPRGYCSAFVSKNSYLWLLKGSVWKRTKKFTVTFSPWGNERRTVKGRVRDLADSVVLNLANKGRLYSLFMSLPCKLFLNYICVMNEDTI